MHCSSEDPPPSPTLIDPCNPSKDESCNNPLNEETDLKNSTATKATEEDSKHNNLILSFAGASVAVIGFLIIGFAGIKLYKAKFSRRRNFNYTLSEDNGNIVGDENRVNC